MSDLLTRFVVGDVLFEGRFGTGALQNAAQEIIELFETIETLSGFEPTKVLVMAGCIDAICAQQDGVDLDPAELIRRYVEAGRGHYIQNNMLGALRKVRNILARLNSGLLKLGIASDDMHTWVRRGLDYPDEASGAWMLIHRTPADQSGWAKADTLVEGFLAHVATLPRATRIGMVSAEQAHQAVVSAIVESGISADADPVA